MDIGPLPEWVTPGQKLFSTNGEMIAWIAMVEETPKETRIWLSWTKPVSVYETIAEAGRGARPWDVDALFKFWRPVV